MKTSPANEGIDNALTIHGVFIDVSGRGVLITGESGIGKSECALDLISKGHCLIADDAVIIERVGDRLFGDAPAGLSGLIHIRDLGIIDVRRLFGEMFAGGRREIDLCVELIKAGATDEADRVGPSPAEFEILGVKVPKCSLIANPARPIALIVETAQD